MTMEHTNGNARYGNSLLPYSNERPPAVSTNHNSSTSSAVFPDFQNFTKLYAPYEEPVNLSNTSSAQSGDFAQQKPSSLTKIGHKKPEAASEHSLGFPKQLSFNNHCSTGQIQASAEVDQSAARATLSLPNQMAPQVPSSQPSTSIPLTSSPVFSAALRGLIYNNSPSSVSISATPQLADKDYASYYSGSKRMPKSSRAAKHSGATSQHPSRNETPQSELNNPAFSLDPSLTTSLSKVPIQPLKRMPTPTHPVKKTPKSRAVIANTYQLILPLPSTNQTSSSSTMPTIGSHLASSSPAIQAALNRPIVEWKHASKKSLQSVEAAISGPPVAQMSQLPQASAMPRHISHSSLQDSVNNQGTGKQGKPRKRSHKAKGDLLIKRSKPNAVDERFLVAARMPSAVLQNAVLPGAVPPGAVLPGAVLPDAYIPSCSKLVSDQLTVEVSQSNTSLSSLPASSDNLLIIQSRDNGNGMAELISSGYISHEARKVEPRQSDIELVSVPVKPDLPDAPRSLLEMRQYHKCTTLLSKGSTSLGTANAIEGGCTTVQPITSNAASSISTSSTKPDATTSFDWILYLRASATKAAPQSAFKHLEASLVNGFQIGMKVETPLRGVDTDKYWLATVVAVYGGVLKLRFDGYGDRSKDFTVACSSGQLHPIGWCSKNQKSLLPPADIRHTQQQWKSFLLNVLQGAKTVPTYLLSSHGCPWMADRIKQGMRLEVQHEKMPTTVWVAKVIRNVGGRMKLRYEGSIDDETDFWLFYLDRRAHPCGWSAHPIIYKPPDEIKEAYDYEAWSNILQEVTSDSNIDRIPSEIFQVHPELPTHTFQVGHILEAIHPSGTYIGPARIFSVINSQYFIVEHIDASGCKGVTQCYYSRHPALFPVGWCRKNSVAFGRPQGINNNQVGEEFTWTEYTARYSAISATPADFMNHIPIHQFSLGQKLEAANPAKNSQICLATIIRIVERLLWLDIYITSTSTTTIIVDVNSYAIFPAGWCESNSYPLTAPLVIPHSASQSIQCAEATHQHGEIGPRIYFNHSCFSGPFLSKSRILELPDSLGPGHIRLIVKEMLGLLLSVGYKSSYILRILQRTFSSNHLLQTQIIKTKCKGKSYEGAIEVCTKRSELKSYCRQICKRLQCCPNLVSPEKVTGLCNEHCYTMTKTQYLILGSRKPGRPSAINPDGTKKKKRRRRKKVFTPKRNLYIPKREYTGAMSEYTGAMSENGSVTSNSVEDLLPPAPSQFTSALQRVSPSFKRSATPRSGQPSTPTSRPSSAADDGRGDLPKNHPLYQLQLTSVKKDAPIVPTAELVPESHQYQIVKEKKKKGRPAKFISPETLQRSKSLNISSSKHYPTVPPLKIRRLELSQSLYGSTGVRSKQDFGAPSPIIASSSSLSTSLPQSATRASSTCIRLEESSAGQPDRRPYGQTDRLLKAAVSHNKPKSALSFSQPRLHINDAEKVVLIDNPLYWDVNKIQSFIKQTDCASLTDKLSAHEVDGQAFMMLVLPTVQEELGLKLGPALKLCHQVQRLKLAFYETFHPEDLVRSL